MNIETKLSSSSQILHMTKGQTTLLKGTAIFLILFDHIGENIGWFPSLPLGAVGVYIFLFLSGYGLMRSADNNGIAGYWRKRIKKVYVPYIAVLALCVVLSIICLHSVSENFIKYLVLWKVPFGEYWYLRIQIKWYIAFFAIWLVKDRFQLSYKNWFVMIMIADLIIVTTNIAFRNYAWTLGAFLWGGGNCSIRNAMPGTIEKLEDSGIYFPFYCCSSSLQKDAICRTP